MKGWELVAQYLEGADLAPLENFAREVERWNRAIRLVGPRDIEGIRVQIVDALLPLLVIPPSYPLLDIGSGAGLPAIPLAALNPDKRIVCLEPRIKRVSFLRHAARTLGLDKVEVIEDRASATNPRPALVSSFSSVTARAVADIPTLLSWAAPLLIEGGEVVLGRGGGEPPPKVEGWILDKREMYEGPKNVGPRFVVRYLRNSR